MSLNAIKTTAGYIVEGTDAVGKEVKLFLDKDQTRTYDHLVEVEERFIKGQQFAAGMAKLPNPERDLYVQIFGNGNEPVDTALHTTLVEAQEARDGISLDWSVDAVTAALRLIAKGQSERLRLIIGQLVDMGPTTQAAVGRHSAGSPDEFDPNWQRNC